MNKITAIVTKNLRLLLRSRVSSLIIIFGPLFLTLLVGMAFNNRGLTSIKIGTYSPEYNPLVNSFLDKIAGAKLSLIKFESEQRCADSIKRGAVNLCLVFPKGFEIAKDSSATTNIITYYVDPSQLNLVYNVKDIISTQLENRTEELSAELTTILLTTLENAKTKIIGDEPAFSEIMKANEVIVKRQQSIKTKLGSLDLTFNPNRFGADSLVTASKEISVKLAGTNGTIRDKLNESAELCNEMKADPEYNSTYFKRDIDTLCSKVKAINKDISSLSDSTINELNLAVTALQRELNTTTKKFTQLKSSRDDILNIELKEMTASSDKIISKMMTIKGDLDTIKKEIDSIQVKETSSIVSPIKTAIKPIVSETYLNYMFPSLIALVIMLVSLLFAQTIVMMEKKSSAYFRNLVTPTKEELFLFANFLTTILLIMLQTFLILSISMLVFKVDILSNLFPTFVFLLLIVTLFTIVGIMIGVLFSSQETSTLAAISFGSIALFISDVILPLESMPTYIRNVAQFNPFVLSEYVLRNTIVFKTPFLTLLKEPYLGVGIPVIFLFVFYILFFLVTLVVLNSLVNKRRIAVRTPIKKKVVSEAEKGQEQVEAEITDPFKKIENLIDTVLQQIKDKEFDKANMIYVHLNELYALLPQEKKKEYFKKIVKIHQELEKASKEKR